LILDHPVYFFEIRAETKVYNGKPGIDAQISWVYTADLQVASAFYQQELGLELVHDQGMARVFATAANACIGVCEAFDGRIVEPRGSLISLVVADVDSWYRRMLERQIDADPPRRIEAFGIYSLRVRAPDGYAIEFQQFER
jgi:catechol 2,3-dioxygenase-like lactoylglutathione lyase family enzyme